VIINPYRFGVPNYTKSLLHFDGTNGSTTFTDESGKTWTPAGNAQISTAQSQFGGASGLFDGAGDYISTPYSADFSILGDFTVECWVYRTVSGRDALCTWYQNATAGFLFDVGASNELRLVLGTGSYISCTSGATTIPLNTWTAVAGVKDGSTLRVFIGGTQVGTLAVSGTVADPGAGLAITVARDPLDASRDLTGYMDEFRFSNVARYTGNYTPAAAAFTYPA